MELKFDISVRMLSNIAEVSSNHKHESHQNDIQNFVDRYRINVKISIQISVIQINEY